MSKSSSKSLIRRQIDKKLVPLGRQAAALMRPTKGWLRTIREALGLTQEQLARRAGLARNSLTDMEHREVPGKITMETLQHLANAMDCDLVYFLKPRKPLAAMVEERAYQHARRTMGAVAHSMALEAQGVDTDEREAQIRELAETLIRETDSRIWDDP